MTLKVLVYEVMQDFYHQQCQNYMVEIQSPRDIGTWTLKGLNIMKYKVTAPPCSGKAAAFAGH